MSKPSFVWLHQMTCHVSQGHFRRFTFLLKERKLSLKNLLKNVMLTSFMLTYNSWMPAYVYTALYNFQCSLAHVILITIFLSQTVEFFCCCWFYSVFAFKSLFYRGESRGPERLSELPIGTELQHPRPYLALDDPESAAVSNNAAFFSCEHHTPTSF